MRIYNPTTSSGGGSGETGPSGATGATGPLPWVLMGEYDNGYSYNIGQAVTYQGGFYYRTGNPLNPGYPPTPGAINASWTPVADRGEQGATGPQGPAGQSSSFFNYQVKQDVGFPPGSAITNGHIVWNNSTQTSATQIAFSHIDYNGNDIDVFFTLYKQNDTFIIQDQSNSNNYQKWLINGTPTIVDNNYLILPVSLVSSGGTSQFADNQRVIFAITSLGLQGATGTQGATGVQGATGTQGATGVQGATGTQISLPLSIQNGGTATTNQELARLAMGGVQQVDWCQTSTVAGTYNVAAGTLTYSTVGNTTFDGGAPAVNDLVILTGQGTSSTPTNIANGPWVVTDIGSASTPVVLTRPSWFTGAQKNVVSVAIKYGQNNAGTIRSVIGPVGTTKSDFVVGTSAITCAVAANRSNTVAITGGTLTGRLTLNPNTANTNPLSFQASTAQLATLQAHAIEWDSSLMYITPASIATSNLKRGINASYIPALTTADILTLGSAQSTVQISALTSTSAGLLGQTILDAVNDALYICTASGAAGVAKWRKVTLSTF